MRGDHEHNEATLRVAPGESVELADEAEARTDGFAIGFVGPHAAAGRQDVRVIVDPDAAQGGFWVTGANETDHHVKHFNWRRDVLAPLGDGANTRLTVADIRNASDGDPSPKNDGGVLHESRGIEVGHVFKLGCKYSDALGLKVLDDHQKEQSVIMGCYGIGVNRILAAAIESPGGHDDGGIVWPAAIAPFHCVITPIKYEGRVKQVADRLHDELTQQGVDMIALDGAVDRVKRFLSESA